MKRRVIIVSNRTMHISHKYRILLGVVTLFVVAISIFTANHQYLFSAQAQESYVAADDITFCDANNNCGYITTDQNDGKKINISTGSQAVVSSLDGNYIFLLSHTDPQIDYSDTNVYIFKKSGNTYNQVQKSDDLELGHANGATYYENGNNKYLLVATNYTYNGEDPQLVRITLKENNSGTLYVDTNDTREYIINPQVFLEKEYRNAVGELSNNITAIAYDNDRGGFYVVTKGTVVELLYFPDDTLFSSNIDAVEPTILRRQEKTVNGITLNAIGKSRAFSVTEGTDGYFFCNQDIAYYNGKIYAVGWVTSGNAETATKSYYVDPVATESYIGVYDVYTGDFTKVFRVDKNIVEAATDQDVIKEVEDVFFIGDDMYASIQKGKSAPQGTYLLKVANTNLYTYNHLYFRHHLNGGTLTSTSDRLSICDSDTPDIVCIDGRINYTSSVNGRMTTGGRIGSGGLWNMGAAKTGYHIKIGEEWLGPDGKTYDIDTVYKVSDFADTSLEKQYIDLYMNWEIDTVITHTVTFDANGGSAVSSLSVEDGHTINPLPTSTRTGYTLVGWFTEQTGGTQLTTSTVISGNITYYAHWTADHYTLTLDNQSATTPGTDSVTATYDHTLPSITIPGRAYVVTYNYNGAGTDTTDTATYTFGGYYTGTNGAGTQYYTADGSSARTWNLTTDTTLYAKWTSASVTLPTPTRTGYTFNGWYTDASGTTKVGDGGASYTPTNHITLYAKWTDDTVDPGDGSIVYIQGRDHTILSNEDLIIKVNYPLDKFSKLLLDGVELSRQYYGLESGSTIITVYSKYLDALNEGEHTLEAVYDDGASFTATITITDDNSSIIVPDTGKNMVPEENSSPVIFIVSPIIALILIVTFYSCHKRKSHIKFDRH